MINVTSAPYNATGNGSTDDTAAIQAAITAAAGLPTGSEVYFPAGTYKITSVLNIGGLATGKGMQLRGDGRGDTIIAPAGSFNSIAVGSSSNVTIKNMSIVPSVTQTGGTAIVSNLTTNLTLQDLIINNAYQGFVSNADSNFLVDNVDFVGILNDGIVVQGGGFGSMRDLTMGGTLRSGTNTGSGIHIISTGGVFMSNCDVTLFNNGMNLAPVASSDAVNWLSINNSDFDTCGTCLMIDPSSASTFGVQGCTFNACWFATSQVGDGVTLQSTGKISGIEFNACRFFNNLHNGVNILNGDTIAFDACMASGNSQSPTGTYYGYNFSISDFALRNSFSGVLGFFGNTQKGLNLASGLSGFTIANNRFGTNVSQLTAGSGYTNFVFTNNTGIPVSALSPVQTLPFGTNPFTYTNTAPQSIALVVSGGVVSSISIVRGSTTAVTGQTQGQFILSPNDTLQVRAGVAPTITMFWVEL